MSESLSMGSASGAAGSRGVDLKSLLRAYERQIIVAALRANDGNQRRAARTLGLLPTTLHEKMKRLGIRVQRSSEVETGPYQPTRSS